MSWKWFVQKEDKVEGPLTADEVRMNLQSMDYLPHHLIWGSGRQNWLTLKAWVEDLPNMHNSTRVEAVEPTWHFALGGQSHGPMAREALITELKKLPSVTEVMLWTQGMKEWVPLYEFHDFLSAVGVNRRQFPRADLAGKAVIKLGGATMIAPLLSISEGGCGIELESGLVTGQAVVLELKSPAFSDTLTAKADVRFVGTGQVGMKFTHISTEAKSAIIQYIKQQQVQFFIKAA
jgi:hypothetical protein